MLNYVSDISNTGIILSRVSQIIVFHVDKADDFILFKKFTYLKGTFGAQAVPLQFNFLQASIAN